MQRISISLTDETAKLLDQLMHRKHYENRSEAIRDLIREKAVENDLSDEKNKNEEAVAVVSYVYNHHERQMSNRMTEKQHHHGQNIISLMHIHISEKYCMEALFLRGKLQEVMHIGQSIASETSVQHGRINCVLIREP